MVDPCSGRSGADDHSHADEEYIESSGMAGRLVKDPHLKLGVL